MSESSGHAIGIDLGTTNSCVAIYLNGRTEVLANEVGLRTTPSYVGFTDDGIVVGQRAQDQAYRNLKNTIFDAKRLIGKKYNDAEIQEGMKFWPFDVIDRRGNPEVKISVKGKEIIYCPEQISAEILKKMKDIASKRVEAAVTKAVITVPAYFNDSQRQATKDAGKIAGLEVLMLLNEPTAAAITYALGKRSKDCKHALVFDLGGGTFDVSIIKFENRRITVKAIHGDSHLGGNDFDKQLLIYLMKDIQEKFNYNIQDNRRAMARLLSACEKLKKALSYQTLAEIDLDVLIDGKDYYTEMNRETFEKLNKELFGKTLEIVEKCLKTASLIPSDIDNVVLVGGSTKIPMIQFLLQDHFKTSVLSELLNPDESVAIGAAIQAANLSNNDSQVVEDFVLEDVVPFSLGIEVYGEFNMHTIIKRNTLLPATVTTKNFTNTHDNQTEVPFRVYEGQSKFIHDNRLLGSFNLLDITPAAKGTVKFDVTFDIDVNGILNVTAIETSSKKKNNITIAIDRGLLSKEALEQMIS